jgi:UDP-N-acetylmuramoyl-L-alanyl-D-glutamate--2,6-diaminopimelate ligase
LKLHTLLSSIKFYKQFGEGNPEITSIVNDNRQVVPGSLFICIKGYTVDSHDFAGDAVARGAVAILAERPLDLSVPVIVVKDSFRLMAQIANEFYEHPTKKFKLIGVTGTNGKTTTSVLLEQVMKGLGQKTGLIGTMYNKVIDRKIETKNTTPDSLTLQGIFNEMKTEGVQTAVMEVSSQALQMGRVHGCDFDIAVFSNLTQDHLDYHHTMENYRASKQLLFAQLGNDFEALKNKFAILNADDEASKYMREATPAQILTYGIKNEADVRATNIQLSLKGTKFTVESIFGNFEVNAKLMGMFNVYNLLAAISVCFALEIPTEDILKTIEKVPGVNGRFEAINEGQDFAVFVDYAATPDSLENVLKTVQEFATNDIYCIIGCGGDRDKTKRPIMAQVACDLSSNAIFTMDNPRTEDPAQILKDMEAGVLGQNFITIQDRREAIEHAINQAKPNDVVLIAGKGHEDYMILGREKIYFDDHEVAREALKARFGHKI